jgi:hypothetical protein
MPRGTSVYDEAKLQGRLWTPLTLRGATRGLKLFIEAFDPKCWAGSGGNWSTLRDKSGQGYDFTATGSIPLSATQGYIAFNGTTQYMEGTGSPTPDQMFPDSTGTNIVTAAYISGVVFVKFQNPTAFNVTNRFGLEAGSRVDWWNDTSGKLESWSESWSSSVLKVGSVRKNASDMTVRLRGLQAATHANTTTPADPSTGNDYSLGADVRSGGSENYANAWVSQWIAVTQSDAMTEQRLEGYAAHALRYEGNYLQAPLVGSHPFVNRPPLLGT